MALRKEDVIPAGMSPLRTRLTPVRWPSLPAWPAGCWTVRKRVKPTGGAVRPPVGFAALTWDRSLELRVPNAKERKNRSQECENTHWLTLLPIDSARTQYAAHADDRLRPCRYRADTLIFGPNSRRVILPPASYPSAHHLHSGAAISCQRAVAPASEQPDGAGVPTAGRRSILLDIVQLAKRALARKNESGKQYDHGKAGFPLPPEKTPCVALLAQHPEGECPPADGPAHSTDWRSRRLWARPSCGSASRVSVCRHQGLWWTMPLRARKCVISPSPRLRVIQ